MGSELLHFQEVRRKIPAIDQLSSIKKAQALQQLLLGALEILKTNPEQLVDRDAQLDQNAYEVVYQLAVQGRTNEQIMEDLNISRMTFYRRQKRAVQRIMDFLLSESEATIPS